MKKLIILSILAVYSLSISAATLEWGSGIGNWTDLNWLDSGVNCACYPDSDDSVIISSGEVLLSSLVAAENVVVTGTGALEISPTAALTLAGTTTGIPYLEVDGADASVVVNGRIDVFGGATDASGIEMYNHAIFVNNGIIVISLSDVGSDGIYLATSSNFLNTGAISIFYAGRHGIYLAFTASIFTNTGSIFISTTEDNGIDSFNGTFDNQGSIKIDETGGIGINMSGEAMNSGTIQIKNTTNRGLSTSENFTNTSTGQIIIGNIDGIMGTIGHTGLQNVGSMDAHNYGLIRIDTYGVNGLHVSSFYNHGIIEIIPIDQHFGLACSGTFINEACATIRSNSNIYPAGDGDITNNGHIFLNTNLGSSIASTGSLTNNGIIEDVQASFDLSDPLFTNNGYVLQPVSGTYDYGQSVSNVLHGAGTGISVGAAVSTNPTGTPVVGNYDQVGNKLTFSNTEAICKDMFALLLTTGDGCPVVMGLPFEEAILPDVANANQILNIKTFLQGPLDIGAMLMKDDLRAAGLIPATDPYLGTHSVSAATLAVTGNDAIVDWMLLEITTLADPSTIIQQVPVLLQRDGDIVDTSGSAPPNVTLLQSCEPYYLRLRHRNHLGVAAEFSAIY